MTDITAKPFDWNDNLSKEALEDFKGIQKDLPYCTCQNIGMALAKLELLEKQGCKVIDPSVSSSEKPNKCEDAINRQAVFEQIGGWIASGEYEFTNATDYLSKRIKAIPPVNPQKPKSEWEHDHEILKAYSDGANAVLDKIRAEIDAARFIDKDTKLCKNANASGLEVAMDIIDKYMAEGSENEDSD